MSVTVVLAVIAGALAVLLLLAIGPANVLIAVAILLLAICEVIRG